MHDASLLLATYVCNALWQVPLLALAGWVACRWMRRLGPAVEHRVWVASLLLSAVLPLERVLLSVRWWPSEARAHGVGTLQLLAGEPRGLPLGSSLVVPRVVPDAICALYLLGLLYFGLRLLWSLGAAVQMQRRGRALRLREEHARALEEVVSCFGLGRPQVLGCAGLHGPVTLSLGKPTLLFPPGFVEGLTVEDFRAAVAHECAHIRRGDLHKQIVYEVVGLLVAFHPVSWLVRRQIARTREMECDALAVGAVGGASVYIPSLLRLASAIGGWPAMDAHAIGFLDANILERRIMFLRAKKRTAAGRLRPVIVAAGVVCLAVAAAGGSRGAMGLAPATGASGQRAGEVYKVGDGVKAPKVLNAPSAVYPEGARRNEGGFKGSCLVGLIVDASGQPQEVHVVRSLGKDFDESALNAVHQYRFAPALRAGVPVAVELRVEVSFSKF